MNRRQYLRSAVGVSLAVSTAGCTLGGDSGEMTESILVNVRDEFGVNGDGAGTPGDLSPPDGVTETDIPEIDLYATNFNRPDENRFVVEGGLRNTTDRPFGHVELKTRLYDVNQTEDEFFDTEPQRGEFGYLGPGQTWTFTHSFRNAKIGTVDYFTATATAQFAETTAE